MKILLVSFLILFISGCHAGEPRYKAICNEPGRGQENPVYFNYVMENNGSDDYSIVSISGEPGRGSFIYLPKCEISEI